MIFLGFMPQSHSLGIKVKSKAKSYGRERSTCSCLIVPRLYFVSSGWNSISSTPPLTVTWAYIVSPVNVHFSLPSLGLIGPIEGPTFCHYTTNSDGLPIMNESVLTIRLKSDILARRPGTDNKSLTGYWADDIYLQLDSIDRYTMLFSVCKCSADSINLQKRQKIRVVRS